MIEPDRAFWKRKQAKILKRKVGTRLVRDTFLIVCEGTKTEPNYFNSFRLTSSDIKEVFGIRANTLSLVEKTLQFKADAARYGKRFDQVWCVFDKDDNTDQNFNEACALAKRKGIKVAYSNECFELWYFLHFHLNRTPLSRMDYCKKLSDILGRKYEKTEESSKEMYDILIDKQTEAIKNASKILSSYNVDDPPSLKNPSTTVYLLVNELNKFLKKYDKGRFQI